MVEHFLDKTKCGMDRWLIFRVNRLRGKCFIDMVHGWNDCSKRVLSGKKTVLHP